MYKGSLGMKEREVLLKSFPFLKLGTILKKKKIHQGKAKRVYFCYSVHSKNTL